MEDSEKLKCILKFLEVIPGQKLNLEQYKKAKDVLNQQEMKIIDEYEEKPKKMTPYNYFIKNYFKDMKNRGTELNGAMILKHAVEAWKQLPEYEKQKYQEQAGQLKIQYDEDLKHFIDTLPQDRKDEVITERKRKKKANIKEDNKKQKTLDNYIIDEAGADVKKDTTPQKTTSTKHKTLKSKLITSETDKGNRKEKNAIKKSEVKNNSQDKNFLNNNAADVKNSSSTKKNKKKKDENLINFEEEETVQKPSFNLKKPPESLYKFYALNVFSGPKASAKYNYKRLTKEERKQLVEKHKKAEEKFLKKFKKYLNTLSVEEMQNIQAKINLEDEDISDITESSDWSEESIE
ncbi:high mobility group protein B3-like [Condylostylus longicornis]|uniref:high mobility group protein B3-like n=1 Tax=Condylostylus longicornis TaxID=2530218 RepID=UPI00244DA2E4|nr:high mobility group protein B3-like [Condylostylus longicornis]